MTTSANDTNVAAARAAAPPKHHLSVSGAAAFRRCPREYQLSREWEPTTRATALGFGLLAHAGLEAWFRTVDPEAALAALRAHASRAALRGTPVDPFDLAACEVLMLGYHERWKDEPLSVLFVEQDFRSAMLNPETGCASRTWELYGRLDAVVRDAHERVFIVEHKTTSSDLVENEAYWQKLRLDAQISTYYEGVRSLGVEPAGVLYDVIRKPTLRPYKATPPEKRKYTKPTKADPIPRLYANMRERDETVEEYRERILADIAEKPDAYYRRAVIERTDTDEREAAGDTWQLAQAMREAVRLGRFPRNPDACVRFGDTCPFFPVCTREASLADSGLYRLRKKEETTTTTETAA